MMNDERFDQLLQDIRDERVSPEQVAAAKERVRKQLEIPRVCANFREDLPAYVAGSLPEARRLLLDDHLGRCSQCRNALTELKGNVVPISRSTRRASSKWPRWAVAAGITVGGLYVGSDKIDAAMAPSGPRATVIAVTGNVDRWPQGSVQAGGTLGEGESIRTGSGARAVLRLADGSQVEMNQRTELAVNAAWSGQTLRLSRGDVMVEAAKQRRGRLRVITHDATASVKGTVFEVSSGTAGTLVSVVEGSVAVSQPGSQSLLTKGQTSATNPSLARNTQEVVSWSQNAEKYSAILGEIANLEKQLTSNPSPRTQPRLLRYLPEGVQIYVAIPNLSGSIRQALFQFEQRARENAFLNEWWTSAEGGRLRQTLDRLQTVTPLLGEETVYAVVRPSGAKPGVFYPLLLSEVQSGREASLRENLTRIAGEQNMQYQIADNLMVVSDSTAHLVASRVGSRMSTEFASQIAERYQRGAGWLVALDTSIIDAGTRESPQGRAIGLSNMRSVIFEQGAGGRSDDNQATFSFTGARTGVASWLASPGSAGSTEYVSPNAVGVLSAATRDPRLALEELLEKLGSVVGGDVKKFEAELGVSVSADIAGSFGTDFTLAVERASIPIPGWVAALEVVRPGVLDSTIQRLVESYNQRSGGAKLTWKQEMVSGRTWTSVTVVGGLGLIWTYDRGYMILSMDQASITRAIGIRDSGASLVHSASFRDQFPASGGLHQSGFVWINAAATGLAELVSNPALKNLLSSHDPILIILDGKAEQIQAASRTRLTSLLVDMAALHAPVEENIASQAVKKKELIAVPKAVQ